MLSEETKLEHDESVKEDWRIQSLADADWALMRIGQLESEAEEVEAVAERRIAEIQERAARLKESAERGIAFFASHLQVWANENKATIVSGERKSRALIHGRIGWRKTPERLVTENAESLVAWCRARPVEEEFVRSKYEPVHARVVEHFEKTGEVPPGVKLEPEGEKFYVKPKGPTNDD